ncbi:MAG: alanine--tRNA ligase [Bacteroidales bacterium]|nr:alanine--tRNA ligase [Bacteroidales bacterium]
MMTSNELRQEFLRFFESKAHHIVPSAPMVVKNDPTLMFTNAGMNQFKDIFLGNAPAKYPRVADSQKCLRVSGKHNDLEEVGHDTYHHTMFEMLGNWSFGDYFKKEAIEWGWEFLTEVLKIDKSCLYVTVFGGDENEGLGKDMEAYEFWKQHIAEDRILLGSKKDNFWEMGDQGPCGPCSEIHVDIRSAEEKAKQPGKDLVNKDHPQVIEIWNLVFMQYNRLANGTLEPLPAKHVDTGMGFERLCMVMQGKQSNYDTDVFQPIIQEIARKAELSYGSDEKADVAMRVCADHLRAVAFSIADGQLPSNAKAGYVIRRILRRAVRYGYTFLGFKEPFIYDLVPTLVNQMGKQFEELVKQQDLIKRIILEEEQSFLRTLSNGILKFERYIAETKGNVIGGAFAFELFDTYGFPIDLTELMAKENGWTVDMQGFQKGLDEQKQRSRAAAAVDTDDWVVVHNGQEEQFVGYDTLTADVEILKYRKVKTKDKEFYQLVFDRTPFYGEGGGQAGDKGSLVCGDEKVIVFDAKKENNLIVHLVESLPADPSATFVAMVDEGKRRRTENNHTATHLLHKALRTVLGTHVEQKGSSVDDMRLRFDFSHFAKLSHDEIRQVERLVNEDIRRNIALEEHRAMPIAEAQKLGAMALFGEKYGEVVRVVKYADSVEFCGGTHVSATGNIGSFRIVAESAIAAGMRRIEAVTGIEAENYANALQDQIDALKDLMKNPKDMVSAIQKLMDENATLQKDIAKFHQEQAMAMKKTFADKLARSGNFVVEKLDMDLNMLKDMLLSLRTENADMAIVLGSTFGDKPSLLVVLGQNRVDAGKNASNIVRQAGKEMQGGGGGQPFFATAGGKNVAGVDKAMEVAKAIIEE